MTSIHFATLLLAISLIAGCVDAQVQQVSAPPTSPEAERKAKYASAKAMFAERCKKSGVFIHRTVEGVEGVYLLKIRTTSNHGDQFRMDDPYGHDSTNDEYLKSFLYGRRSTGSLTNKPEEAATPGYRYVEALDPEDGKRYRYTGSMKVVGKKDTTAVNVKLNLQRDSNYDLNIYAYKLDRFLAPSAPPRYGVLFDDLSTREEREHWIAGSSLKVIDLKTNEVIAERIGYMMDPGQGAKGGGRSPWLLAADVACPKFPLDGDRQTYQGNQTRNFVEKVLKPKGIE